jgi:hypothetical protein
MLKKNLEMRPPACWQTSRLTSTLYLARRTYAGGIEDTASWVFFSGNTVVVILILEHSPQLKIARF